MNDTADRFDPRRYCIAEGVTVREAIACIDRNQAGIALVVDVDGRLRGTIVDGDIRRAVLAGVSPEASVDVVLARKAAQYRSPVSANQGTAPAEILRLMREASVRQIPILDGAGRVVDLVTMEALVPDERPLRAVIMAGGQGTRMRPLTENLPKPMLPIGDKPILEHIIEQLRSSGVKDVNVTTNYLADKITDYFEGGERFGVEINYVPESRPLGTAGAVSLVKPSDDPLLVINGDILTQVDFREMLAFHREHKADLTVGLRRYEFKVPFGVVRTEGERVLGLVEKPTEELFVNAGIYLLEPGVQRGIPKGERVDMTDIIMDLIATERRVVGFPIWEYWMDVGQPADYRKAQEDHSSGGPPS